MRLLQFRSPETLKEYIAKYVGGGWSVIQVPPIEVFPNRVGEYVNKNQGIIELHQAPATFII